MSNKAIREALATITDTASIRHGVWIAKRNYFHRRQGGGSPENLALKIQEKLKNLEGPDWEIERVNIVDTTDHFKAWPTQSYFEVRFTVVIFRKAKLKVGDKVTILECEEEEDADLRGKEGTIVRLKKGEMLNPNCYMVEIPGLGRIGFDRKELTLS